MLLWEQAQYSTTPQMAPRKTPSADMAMMVMRMGSRVFSMFPGLLSSLLSCERESIAVETQKHSQSVSYSLSDTPTFVRAVMEVGVSD